MEDVMNLITIRMTIDMRLIQMKNGMIIRITMNKVKFLMVVGSTNVKQVVKFVMAQLILQNVQLVWMDLLSIQQLLNAWDVMINAWLAVQTISETVLLATQDGPLMVLTPQEFSLAPNAQQITVVNAILWITVRNAKTFTSANQKLPVNLASLTAEHAKILLLAKNVSVVTFWLNWMAPNHVFCVQVDVPLAQVWQIVSNVTQVTLWTVTQRFVKNVLQIVGNAPHQLIVRDV